MFTILFHGSRSCPGKPILQPKKSDAIQTKVVLVQPRSIYCSISNFSICIEHGLLQNIYFGVWHWNPNALETLFNLATISKQCSSILMLLSSGGYPFGHEIGSLQKNEKNFL